MDRRIAAEINESIKTRFTESREGFGGFFLELVDVSPHDRYELGDRGGWAERAHETDCMDERRLRGPAARVGSQDRAERLDGRVSGVQDLVQQLGRRPSSGSDQLFHERMRIGLPMRNFVSKHGLGLGIGIMLRRGWR